MMRRTELPQQQKPATRLRNLMADTDFGMDFANGQDSVANDSEASTLPANSTSTVKMSKSDGPKQAKGFILPRRMSGALKQSTVEENPKPAEPQQEPAENNDEDDLQIHQAVPIRYAPEQIIKPARQITEKKKRPARRQEYEEESSDDTPSYEHRSAKRAHGKRNRVPVDLEYSDVSDEDVDERYDSHKQRRRDYERRRNEYSEDSEPLEDNRWNYKNDRRPPLEQQEKIQQIVINKKPKKDASLEIQTATVQKQRPPIVQKVQPQPVR